MTTDFSSDIIIKKSFKTFFKHFLYFSILATIALAVAFLISYFILSNSTDAWLPVIFSGIIAFVIYTKCVVLIHRSVLFNEFDLRNIIVFKKNEFLFGLTIIAFIATYMVLFFLFTYALVAVFGNQETSSPLVGYIAIAFYIVLAIVFSRLAIIFPSLAVSNPLSLQQCWHKTKNHKASMFGLVIVFPFLTNIFLKVVPENTLTWIIIGVLIAFLVSIVEIIIISHCYQWLIQDIDVNSEAAIIVECETS